MTEVEWLTSMDPKVMLDFLNGKASERKLRLFATGCCRRIWRHLKDQGSRRLIEVSEMFADGAASSGELSTAFEEAGNAQEAIHWEGGDAVDQSAAEAVLGLRPDLILSQAMDGATEAAGEFAAGEVWDTIYRPDKHWSVSDREYHEVFDAGEAEEKAAQAELLRCIIGNPFKPAMTTDSSWPTPEVSSLAQSIYAEQTFDRLPELADALDRAGCTKNDILGHCRGPGSHVRGCWVIDLTLGKE